MHNTASLSEFLMYSKLDHIRTSAGLLLIAFILSLSYEAQANPMTNRGNDSPKEARTLQKRGLSELINKTESAWPQVQELIKQAKNQVEILPPSSTRDQALVETQVTTRSPMGTIIYETGGLLVDHAWIRILGGGNARLPQSLPQFNQSVHNSLERGAPPILFVAYDAVGGFFAVDGGALGKRGNVFYMAPDTLEWFDMQGGYSDFLMFCLNGDVGKFYENLRWPGWQPEVAKLKGDQGIFIYPFPSASGPPIGKRHRGVVPITELFSLHVKALK